MTPVMVSRCSDVITHVDIKEAVFNHIAETGQMSTVTFISILFLIVSFKKRQEKFEATFINRFHLSVK